MVTDNKTASAKPDANSNAKPDMPDNKKPTAEKTGGESFRQEIKSRLSLAKSISFYCFNRRPGFAGWKGWFELQNQIQSRTGPSDQLQADISTLQGQLKQQQELNQQMLSSCSPWLNLKTSSTR